jgi:hypothetical protein
MYRDMIARAEKHGFAWSMWSYGGAFGVVEEFDGRKAEPDVLEMVLGRIRLPDNKRDIGYAARLDSTRNTQLCCLNNPGRHS